MEDLKVIDNPAHHRFELDLGNGLAFIEYGHFKDDLVIMHTYVPESHRGMGIASIMIHKVLEYIQSKHLKIIIYCPAVNKFIEKHPEFEDLLDAEYRH